MQGEYKDIERTSIECFEYEMKNGKLLTDIDIIKYEIISINKEIRYFYPKNLYCKQLQKLSKMLDKLSNKNILSYLNPLCVYLGFAYFSNKSSIKNIVNRGNKYIKNNMRKKKDIVPIITSYDIERYKNLLEKVNTDVINSNLR
tara:strand:+ start:82 stop:513 length:432 start_codon:yes stop_codon:yes gene_type:complete